MKQLFIFSLLIATQYTATAQNVGIGQSNPLYKLHVTTNNPSSLLLDNTQGLLAGAENSLHFRTGSFYTGGIKSIGITNSTARLGFFTKSHLFSSQLLERLSISDEGYVGINNISPASTLDVNGSMSITGPATLGGNMTVTGNTILQTLKIAGGQPGLGKVLTSDASGNASWKKPNEGTTHTVMVPALSMVPNSPNEFGFYALPWGTGMGRGFIAGNTSGRIMAPVTLPDGATIKKIRAVCYLNDPEIVGIWLRMGYYEKTGASIVNGGISASAHTAVQNTGVQTIVNSEPITHVVNNLNRVYELSANLYAGGKWKAANSIIFWFEVEYDL